MGVNSFILTHFLSFVGMGRRNKGHSFFKCGSILLLIVFLSFIFLVKLQEIGVIVPNEGVISLRVLKE